MRYAILFILDWFRRRMDSTDVCRRWWVVEGEHKHVCDRAAFHNCDCKCACGVKDREGAALRNFYAGIAEGSTGVATGQRWSDMDMTQEWRAPSRLTAVQRVLLDMEAGRYQTGERPTLKEAHV